jgi:hypothetical protein
MIRTRSKLWTRTRPRSARAHSGLSWGTSALGGKAANNTSLGACLSAHFTTSGILRFNSDASANLRNVAPPSSHLRVASAFAWTSTNCRWTVSHDSSRVNQCVALLGLQSLGDSGSLGFLADPVVFFTPSSAALILSAQRAEKILCPLALPLSPSFRPLHTHIESVANHLIGFSGIQGNARPSQSLHACCGRIWNRTKWSPTALCFVPGLLPHPAIPNV